MTHLPGPVVEAIPLESPTGITGTDHGSVTRNTVADMVAFTRDRVGVGADVRGSRSDALQELGLDAIRLELPGAEEAGS